MPMGKSGVGAVVSQSRKSGCGLVIFSRAFSSSFSQRMSRWQFCSISQWPRAEAVSSSCRATWEEEEEEWILRHASWNKWTTTMQLGGSTCNKYVCTCTCMYYINGKLDEEVTCTTNIHTTLMQKAFFSFKKTAHFFLALSHG